MAGFDVRTYIYGGGGSWDDPFHCNNCGFSGYAELFQTGECPECASKNIDRGVLKKETIEDEESVKCISCGTITNGRDLETTKTERDTCPVCKSRKIRKYCFNGR